MNPRQVVAVGLAVFAVFAGRAYWAKRRATGVDQKGWTVPALQVGEEEALALEAVTEKRAGERRIRLVAPGGGEAVVILKNANADDSQPFAFGKAVLEPAGGPERGAGLVQAVAGWLRAPVPPAGPAGVLAPFPMTYARLGAHDGWEANKLFFERGDQSAEVFLNLSADGRQARLLEKDPDYRQPLLAMLAMILRDGQPARRTPQNDPLLASAEPLFRDFQPLAGEGRVREIVAAGSGFLGVREVARQGKRACELWRWTHPGQAPVRVAELDGVIARLEVAPDDKHALLNLVHPKEKGALRSDDPGLIGLVDLRTGKFVGWQESGSSAYALAAVFAPDSARLAFSVDKSTRVHDLGGRELARTESALELAVVRWEDGELLLRRLEFDDSHQEKLTYYRWRPGQGRPHPVRAPPLSAPDGRYTVEPTKEGILVRGPGGPSELVASRKEDREAFANLRSADSHRWVGPAGLVVALDELMVLDLATGKMRYLFPPGHMYLKAASADGKLVVAEDGDNRTVWAERR